MSAKLKIKRGTTTSWADSANKDTTLEPGQLGVEYLADGNMRLKVGKQTDNGSATDWSLLPYVTPLTSVYQDDHIELYSGYKTLSVNTEGYVTNPGTYGTIHLGDPSSPYHNIRLNGDSEVVLSAPTTIVQGALSVIPATEVELKVSEGDYSGSPKLSSVGSSRNSYLQIANLIADSAAGGTSRGIEFVSSFKTNSARTYSLRWGFNSSNFPCLYSVGSPRLGYSDYQWEEAYLRNIYVYNKYSLSKGQKGGDSESLLNFYSNNTFSVTSGDTTSTGTIRGGYLFNFKHSIKSSGSSSVTQLNSRLKLICNNSTDRSMISIESEDCVSNRSQDLINNNMQIAVPAKACSSSGQYVNSLIQFKLGGASGTSTYTNYLNLYYHPTTGLQLFPIVDEGTDKSSFLGTSSRHWTKLYVKNIINSDGTINCDSSFQPSTNSTSTSTGRTLGSSHYKWRYLYAYSGTIQTSDRSAKDSIHYLESNESSDTEVSTMSLRSNSVENKDSSLVTIEDVIDFVTNLSPVTFCYKDGQGEDVEATEENSDPEEIQLGLIADDIKDHKLFKYVGVETTYEEEITPAVKDEEGNVVTKAVTETKTTLGLQAIPLTTAALTACKYLIQKNLELESRLESLEDQVTDLLNQ